MKQKIKNFFIKNQVLLKAMLATALFFFNSIFNIIPRLIFRYNPDKISFKYTVLLSFYDYLVLIVILFFLYKKDIIKYIENFKKNKTKIIDKGFSYWTIGIIIMMISNFLIMKYVPMAHASNEIQVQEMIKAMPIICFITVGIFGPIIEEFVFRKTLYDLFKNKDIFVITSGIIFGFMHVIFSYTSGWDFLFVIPYGALGICLAMMYKKTDNLLTPMMMHIIHNVILVLISIIGLSI